MNKIYIILMQTYTVPAKLIRIFTRYKYSHVGISLHKDCETIYSFGRRKWNRVWDSGFNVEHKNGDFFKYFKDTICKIYEVEVSEEQYKMVKDMLEHMEVNQNEYKYDYFGIIPRYFRIPFRLKNRYVCSYFVANLLEQAKIYAFSKDVSFIIPKDFEKLNILKEIYSGKYLSYK